MVDEQLYMHEAQRLWPKLSLSYGCINTWKYLCAAIFKCPYQPKEKELIYNTPIALKLAIYFFVRSLTQCTYLLRLNLASHLYLQFLFHSPNSVILTIDSAFLCFLSHKWVPKFFSITIATLFGRVLKRELKKREKKVVCSLNSRSHFFVFGNSMHFLCRKSSDRALLCPTDDCPKNVPI